MKTKLSKLTVLVAVVASLGMSGKASAFGLNWLRDYYDQAALGGNYNAYFKQFGDLAKVEYEGKTNLYGTKSTTPTAPSTSTSVASAALPVVPAGTFLVGVGLAPTNLVLIEVPRTSLPAAINAVSGAGTWAPGGGYKISGGTLLSGATIFARFGNDAVGIAGSLPPPHALVVGAPATATGMILAVDTGANPPGVTTLPTATNDVAGGVAYSITNVQQPAEITASAAAKNTNLVTLSTKPVAGQYLGGPVAGTGIPPNATVTALYNNNTIAIASPLNATRQWTGSYYAYDIPAGAKIINGAQATDNGAFETNTQYANGLAGYYTQYAEAWLSYWTWLGYQNFAVLTTNLANGAAARAYGRSLADQFADAANAEAAKYVYHNMAAGVSWGFGVGGDTFTNHVLIPAGTFTSVTIRNPDSTGPAFAPGIPTTDPTNKNRSLNRFAVGDLLTGTGLPANCTITAVDKTTGVVTFTPAGTAPIGGYAPTFTSYQASKQASTTNPFNHGAAFFYLYGSQPAGTNYLGKNADAATANAQYAAWFNGGAQAYALAAYYKLVGPYYNKYYSDEALRLNAVASIGLAANVLADNTAANTAVGNAAYLAALYQAQATYWWDLTISQ